MAIFISQMWNITKGIRFKADKGEMTPKPVNAAANKNANLKSKLNGLLNNNKGKK